MILKYVGRGRQGSQDVYFCYHAMLLLLPEKRNAAADLDEAEDVMWGHHDGFGFYKISAICVIIDAATDQAHSSHCNSSPREDSHFDWLILIWILSLLIIIYLITLFLVFIFKDVNLINMVLYEPLHDCQSPKRIYVLEVEILKHWPIPYISQVHKIELLLILRNCQNTRLIYMV